MAIFHMSVSNISNGKGRSAIASASYRSGTRLYDEKEGRSYFYNREIKPETFILKPKHAPEWCLNRERLWNEVEKKENRVNSRYAKEFNVSLPIELNNEEQKELLLDYVQKNFVDEGMVADIAIHRDHEENPHAHVMLTNRPFNQDGSWGEKSKTEYILDEKGDKTYTKNGNLRQRKIWLVDWDKKEKIEEWRSNWAEAINKRLKEKGLTERVSHKSFERQGIKQEPTVHVGSKKNKDRIAYNEAIKKRNKYIKQENKIRQQEGQTHHAENLKKYLSYQERHEIKELSKSLKTYVDFENIDDKRRMLNNWKNSVLIKKITGIEVSRQIALINQEELNINKANELLDRVSDRVVNKLYPQLKDSNITKYEKRELVEETLNNNQVYRGQELSEKMEYIRENILNKRVVTLTKRPAVSLRLLEQWDNKNQDKIIKQVEGIDISVHDIIQGKNLDKLKDLDKKTLEEIGKEVKFIRNNYVMENIIKTQYKTIISKAYPQINQDNLKSMEKEQLYMFAMYYNPQLKPYSIKDIKELSQEKIKPVFSHEEHKIGLKVLSGEKNINTVDNKRLRKVLGHQSMQQVFIYECREDEKLNQDEVTKVRKHFMKNENYIDEQRKEEFEEYKPLKYPDMTAEKWKKAVLTENIINDLTRQDYSKYEQEHHKAEERKLAREMNKKHKGKKKGKKQNINNNLYL